MSYWFIWPVGIVIWLVLGWAAFAYFEAKALQPNAPKNHPTLSYFVYTIGAKFPLSIFLGALFVGLFWGILGTHFFWHFCPPGSTSSGFLMLEGWASFAEIPSKFPPM